jgi:hypothetical protein
MAYASKAGRARVSAKSPSCFGVCDRCGIWNNLVNLQWQYEWRGTSLQNIWLRVCKRCKDVPQEQLRAIQIPADPTPVWQPRVENFEAAEADYRTLLPNTIDPITGTPVINQTRRATTDEQDLIDQPYGQPVGLEQNAVMPYSGAQQKAFGVVLPIVSVISNGTGTIFVTCSAAHNLVNNDQVSVEGLSDTRACGFFSITMFTATLFTYTVVPNIPSTSLLTSTTRIVTALVGVPYGSDALPQVMP